jgi:hypothetical protein
MRTLFLTTTLLICLTTPGSAQIKAGFDAAEYDDMLWFAFYGLATVRAK